MTPTIEALADGLSEAQRAAIEWLPLRGWTEGPAYWQVSNTLAALARRMPALCKSRPNPRRSQSCGSVLQWRLTPLGLAVRRLLQEREGR